MAQKAERQRCGCALFRRRLSLPPATQTDMKCDLQRRGLAVITETVKQNQARLITAQLDKP